MNIFTPVMDKAGLPNCDFFFKFSKIIIFVFLPPRLLILKFTPDLRLNTHQTSVVFLSFITAVSSHVHLPKAI